MGDQTELIRVLVVDNNPETREKIRNLLGAEKDLDVVGIARTGKEAIEMAQDKEPDVVVLDVDITDMDEITITESICRRVPFTQVIILAVQVDPPYMRRAMLAGARDFIVKPPLADELRSAVYRAGGLAHEKRDASMRVIPQSAPEAAVERGVSRGRIIQVYAPKGGTGVTTLATNLAVSLHSEDTKAVIVDGNLQYGDVAIFLNEIGYHSILDLAPRIDDLDPQIVQSVLVKHEKTGLDILIAPNRPEMAEKVSGEDFFKVLQFLRRMYSFVVVDTPSELNDITLAVMDAADLIVLLTTQDIAAVKNARLFLSVVDGLHINRQRIAFVMNRFDKRVAISPETVAENLKQPVVSVIPLDDAHLVRAANQGVPFVVQSRTETVSRALLGLTDVIKQRLLMLDTKDISQVKVFKEAA